MPVRHPLLRCTWSLTLALFAACDSDDPEIAVPLPPQVLAPAPPPPPLPIPPLPLAVANKSVPDPDDQTPPDITGVVADVTPDGAASLFAVGRDPADIVLSEIDLDRRITRRIYPPADETAAITAAAYADDASIIYIVVDEGDDTPLLITLDRDSGEELAPRVPAPAA